MPPTQENLRQRARLLMDAREWSAAQTILEALLLQLSGDVSARIDLAQVTLAQGMFRASGNHLLKAASHPPRDPTSTIQLAQRLCFSGEIPAARDCLDCLARHSLATAPLLFAQAQLRWTLGEFEIATQLMDRAATIGFDAPAQFHLYAILLQATGEIGQAGQVLETCLQRWPDFGDAATTRSNLRRQTPASNHVDFLHGQLPGLPASGETAHERFVRAEFESALFKELDDLGRYDEAWPALARCNALMSSINPYDGAGEATVTEALVDVASSLDQPKAGALQVHAGPTPIFIVGMPRSGTTLLDRMLSSHSQVTSAGEINDFLRQFHWVADVPPVGVDGMLGALLRAAKIDLTELGARYLAQTQWRAQGRRFYIDKLPVNIQMVPFIRRALPQAPIVHMMRDSMDVCFSNFRAMFGNVSAYSYDMRALAHYYGLYRRLADQWRATMPDAMLDVHYSDLVQDPASTLRRVLKHCGLQQEDACLHPERNTAPVATPSSMQVREPIHTRGLAAWQPYAQHLQPLRQLLG